MAGRYFPTMNTSKKSQQRVEVRAGLTVDIIQKADQLSGKRTRGVVREVLTGSAFHPHGIKVRLTDGRVGRVAEIISTDNEGEDAPGT